jgi:hypothetical protein
MSVESLFRIAFWLIFGGMIVMQVYFASRLRLAGDHTAADRKAIEREGWGMPSFGLFDPSLLSPFLCCILSINRGSECSRCHFLIGFAGWGSSWEPSV